MNPRRRKETLWLAISGFLVLGFSGYLAKERLNVLREGITTTGIVQRRFSEYSRLTRTVYVWVSYSDSGKTHSSKIAIGVTWWPSASLLAPNIKVGDSVPVIFDPRDPEKAYLNTTRGLWQEVWFMAGMAIFLLALSIPWMKKKRIDL